MRSLVGLVRAVGHGVHSVLEQAGGASQDDESIEFLAPVRGGDYRPRSDG